MVEECGSPCEGPFTGSRNRRYSSVHEIAGGAIRLFGAKALELCDHSSSECHPLLLAVWKAEVGKWKVEDSGCCSDRRESFWQCGCKPNPCGRAWVSPETSCWKHSKERRDGYDDSQGSREGEKFLGRRILRGRKYLKRSHSLPRLGNKRENLGPPEIICFKLIMESFQ